ncbi:VanZ family protein [Flavobacterium sp.]|uniref:VanZ family protein n=1 Tax=Flavobacterium sp. TaxID=239 RepID=UPI002B4B5CE7|nr:VanZ family protein [Flavobacterium sp.]HLF53322.1 VanZ family protein [Flavobacterium sp.]
MPKQIYFWAALFWTFAIAFLCLVSIGNVVPQVSLQNADKYVHFTFHFVFTWLWFLYFSHEKIESSNAKTILAVFLLSFIYGISVEIMQGFFTIARKADIYDVLANTTGAVMAVISIRLYQKYMQKRKLSN